MKNIIDISIAPSPNAVIDVGAVIWEWLDYEFWLSPGTNHYQMSTFVQVMASCLTGPGHYLIRYCWHLYQCKLTVIYMWLTYLISAISFAPIWRNKIRCTFTGHTKIYSFCNWDVMVYGNMWRDWIIRMITHYRDVIIGTITFQITSLTIVYSTVYSDADQRKH